MKRFIPVILLFICTALQVDAETIIRDKQQVFGAWKIEQSPYFIQGEAVVPKGKTLTIAPGTVVNFRTGENYDYSDAGFDVGFLKIEGTLIARGKADNPIMFTRNGDYGYWGLLLFNTSKKDNLLQFVQIRYANRIINSDVGDVTGAVSFHRSAATIDSTIISHNNGVGIHCWKSSHPRINNSIIAYNKREGIEYEGNSSPVITSTILWGNQESFWNVSGRPRIAYSLVQESSLDQGIVDRGRNIFGENPGFNDPDNFDFSVEDDSPVIGSGKGGTNIGAFFSTAGETTLAGQFDRTPPVIYLPRGIKLTGGNQIKLRGQAVDQSPLAAITVNGKRVAFDEEGNFEASVYINPSRKIILVAATDLYGNRAVKKVAVDSETSRDMVAADPLSDRQGKYYALLIANQDYISDTITDLAQPLIDVHRIRQVLTRYRFDDADITILKNASRGEIITSFDGLSRKLTRNDSLLIFYAGHGFWDERFKQGYWLPSNASQDSRSNWLSNSTVRDYIRGINSRHTLLVVDACFAGGIFKTRSAFKNANKAIKELYRLPSRKALTSGTLTEVPDKSVFVDYLVKRLTENQRKYLPAEQLYIEFKAAVINNSALNQVPQFGEVREAGDEGGDFVFILND